MAEPVSIILPVFNGERYIEAAIRSVLGQTYRDFELLILNDGSTDRTLELCAIYAQDPRVRIVDHADRAGITHRLNEGLALARYEWIARMDADDICHPWRIAHQMAYVSQHPKCVLVATQVHVIDENGRYLRTEGLPAAFLYYSLHFECCIFHPTILFQRKAILDIGGYQLPFAEDYDLFVRTMQRYRLGGVDEPLLSYRIHQKSTHRHLYREAYASASNEVSHRVWLSVCPDLPPASYLRAYQYDYSELHDVEEMQDCLETLDRFSITLLHLDNPNRHIPDMLYIWSYKRNLMLQQMAARLSPGKARRFIGKQMHKAPVGPVFPVSWCRLVWQKIRSHGISS